METIDDVGEFGLIARVRAKLPLTNAETLVPSGDDAALLAVPDGRLAASADLLLEGRHFRRDWSSARDIGHKAAAQNFADIAAMGGVPTTLLLSMVLPGDLPVAWVEELAEGIGAECALVGAIVAGGDMVRGELITISVTVFGTLEGRAPVLRSGARAGNVVAVAGRLGWSAAGMELLAAGSDQALASDEFATTSASGEFAKNLALDEFAKTLASDELANTLASDEFAKTLIEAHRRPQPPYAAGPQAARAGATAMLDVSDGLLADLGHLAVASEVAVDVQTALLDIPPSLRLDQILTGGEDHALAATFPPTTPLPPGWRAIGTVHEGPASVTVDGKPWTGPGGFSHFG